MKKVRVTNMTSLFSKEMLIYSFFDLRLQSPLRVMALLYFVILFVVVSIPVLLIAWPPNVYSAAIAIGIPFGGSIMMSKPIWNGKSFISFAKTQYKYLTRAKITYDWVPRPKDTIYEVKGDIILSRHEDYQKLYRQVKEEE